MAALLDRAPATTRPVLVAVSLLGLSLACLHVAPAMAAGPDRPGPVTVTGELEALVVDAFEHRQSETLYFLKDRQGNGRLQLDFQAGPPALLERAHGRPVTATGRMQQGRLVLDDPRDLVLAAGSSTGGEALDPGSAAVSGDQRALVLLADFQDAPLDCSAAQVRDIMFSDTQGRTVDMLYRESSQGAVSFSGQVLGPYRIPYSSAGCDISGWASALEAKAAAAGIDVAQFPRKIYVVPRQNACNASGYGSMGGTESQAWIMRCELPGLYAHELGHNLGMNHASTLTSEYGDGSDPMGMEVLGLRQHNAPHLEQMGWRAASQFKEVSASGRFELAPTTLGAAEAVAPQAIVLSKPDTGDFYFVSYRAPAGFDANLTSGLLDRLHVHRYARNGGRTTYVTGLLVGETFEDAANGIRIAHVARAVNYATVDVTVRDEGSACMRLAPAVSVAPSSQAGAAGSALDYRISVTSRDSAACPASSYSIAAAALPAGWGQAASPANLLLSPGATATSTLRVTSSGTAGASPYVFSVSASDGTLAGHSATSPATYVVETSCVRRAPTLTLSPESQSGVAGTPARYGITLSNPDDPACTSTTYALSRSLPGGWAGVLSRTSVTLAPGSSAELALDVTAPSGATPGSYTFRVDATDTASRSAADLGNFTVSGTSPDTEAPSIPGGLLAGVNVKQLRVSLSWEPSTDDVAVSGYRIWRDGQAIGRSDGALFTDGTVTLGTTYRYAVTAFDAAGNESPPSVVLSVTVARTNQGGGGNTSAKGGKKR